MALNETQRNILNATLEYPLSAISAIGDEKSLAVLRLMFQPILGLPVSNEETRILEEWKVLDEFNQISQILAHPAPQNRSMSNEYVETALQDIPEEQRDLLFRQAGVSSMAEYLAGHAVYTTTDQFHPEDFKREPEGLLSLTARNDATTEPVTKEDVTDYIVEKVKWQILSMHERGVRAAILKDETTPTEELARYTSNIFNLPVLASSTSSIIGTGAGTGGTGGTPQHDRHPAFTIHMPAFILPAVLGRIEGVGHIGARIATISGVPTVTASVAGPFVAGPVAVGVGAGIGTPLSPPSNYTQAQASHVAREQDRRAQEERSEQDRRR